MHTPFLIWYDCHVMITLSICNCGQMPLYILFLHSLEQKPCCLTQLIRLVEHLLFSDLTLATQLQSDIRLEQQLCKNGVL